MSESEDDAKPGRGKITQRHKREMKALMEQKRIESGKLMSFAKAKRENKKIEARQEKRDLEDKYKALEESMKQRHAQELEAFESLDESLENETGAAEYLEIDPNEGTRKSRLQKKKDLLAEIEKELREGPKESQDLDTMATCQKTQPPQTS